MRTLRRYLFLLIYHFLARHIPDRFLLNQIGVFLRRLCAKNIFPHCGWGLHLHPDVEIGRGDKIHIGNRCAIGIHSYLHAAHEHIYIGDYTQIGPNVHIITNSHIYRRTDYPIQRQGLEFAPVYIGKDVQIGVNAVILPGVTIHDGAIVGANCVVTKDVPPYAVVVPPPALVKFDRRSLNPLASKPRRRQI